MNNVKFHVLARLQVPRILCVLSDTKEAEMFNSRK